MAAASLGKVTALSSRPVCHACVRLSSRLLSRVGSSGHGLRVSRFGCRGRRLLVERVCLSNFCAILFLLCAEHFVVSIGLIAHLRAARTWGAFGRLKRFGVSKRPVVSNSTRVSIVGHGGTDERRRILRKGVARFARPTEGKLRLSDTAACYM